MSTEKKQTAGYTLIELIVTIAVLAILVAVSVGGVMSVRERARVKAAEAQMGNAQAGAVSCINRRLDLATTVPPQENKPMCMDVGRPETAGLLWPDLPPGWSYLTVDAGSNPYAISDISTRTFEFAATNGTKNIVCNETGCVTS